MDFFSAQDKARRKSTVLIIYFIFAVAFIIIGVYGAVLIGWTTYHDRAATGLWHPNLFLFTALGVLLVVLTGVITKSLALSKGGEAVATLLGGVPLSPNTVDPDEKRFLNVVEEMAIASGLPVPSAFILPEESGINAFAAGIDTSDAVVAVTAGCLKRLHRDQLQGVVAHEFSHILNGDMRLNVRLMGMIYGILILASLGRVVLRGGAVRGPRSRGRKGGGAWPILAMALIIMAIGYIGVFFGRLIQASVSRQREFLADAAAVQFTRNPAGLAGALRKIAALSEGSRLSNPNAEEAGHFFFSTCRKSSFTRWFATHPPLEDRIKKLESTSRGSVRPEPSQVQSGISDGDRVRLSPAAFAAAVGSPQPRHLSYAEKIMADLPSPVKEACHEPFGAQALVFCLLLNKDGPVKKTRLDWLGAHADTAALREVERLMPFVDRIDRGLYIPLVDMAVPALKTLSPGQYQAFRRIFQSLVGVDRKVSLFEYALHRILVRHLDGFFTKKTSGHRTWHTVQSVEKEIFLLLSTLAWTGSQVREAAQESFVHGLAQLSIHREITVYEKEECTFKALDRSLGKLARTAPVLKRKLLTACVACVAHDNWLSLDEFEILRAVADAMDLPVPPVFPGKFKQA